VPAQWIEPGATLGASRGEIVVCIPVYGAHEQFVGCLRSVLAHTPRNVKLLICDDASPDERSSELVTRLDEEGTIEHELFYMRREKNVGFPANVNGGFAAAAPADVLILNSDCVVGEGWVDGLRDAAYTDSTVATATALTNNGSVLSVPERGVPLAMLPQEWSFEEAAAAVRARSPRLRPRILTAVGHCAYVCRSALELVGDFDLAFSPGYGEEVDFSQRCLRSGLCHVVADEVLVLHHGGASLTPDGKPNPFQAEHERMIRARYPYYAQSVTETEQDVTGPLARSLSAARRALKGLSVVIDGRILTAGPMTGTQLHVLELIAAVARTGDARVSALVPPQMSPYADEVLETLDNVERVHSGHGIARRRSPRGDVVHRPFQVSSQRDLPLLAQFGERLVVTHQDLIGYRNPSYSLSFEEWDAYRRLTRRSLAFADRAIFFSAHARNDAIAEDLVEPHRASVVPIGVDHVLSRLEHAPVPPRGSARLPSDAELIVAIGTDFRHKNRLFALRVLSELQQRHGWKGRLAFVGPRVERGSSAGDEDELMVMNPRLADAVIDFAAVDEAEKAWLMGRARLVLYPTVYEGFGLVPFEAADRGVPCLWARGTSLSELLPDSVAGIVPWDAEVSADHALELMRDEPARKRNIEAIRAAAARLTWDSTAASLVELYNAVCDQPPTPTAALERTTGLMHGGVSEDALRLIGPGGALPRDVERPLLALATHPRVGVPVFRIMKAGYRASNRWRRIADSGGRNSR
jgi:glycosyltransferase involved in cell wall biosynthesis/GT2 family glycosyltransferase